jgi:hypothetical protein
MVLEYGHVYLGTMVPGTLSTSLPSKQIEDLSTSLPLSSVCSRPRRRAAATSGLVLGDFKG